MFKCYFLLTVRKVLAIWLAKGCKQLDCNSQKHSDQSYCFLSVYKLHVPCKTHEPLFAHVWSSMHLYVICCFSRCAMRGLTTSCVEWTGYYRHIRCMIYFYRLMSGMSLVIDGSMKQSSQQQLGFLFYKLSHRCYVSAYNVQFGDVRPTRSNITHIY